jgi:DNA mismatch repair protein PMS2
VSICYGASQIDLIYRKKVVAFATRSNPTTKDNIANVYGAKTLLALIPLDLTLELQPTGSSKLHSQKVSSNAVHVTGHISRPVFGEGRQTPDRQMFFVNSRPCLLPQVAKAFNEVYKSYNVSQAPFIFANLNMDTNSYDVNVSPDKRTILLHEQTTLLETLKVSLTGLFERHQQSVPHSQLYSAKKLSSTKPQSVSRSVSNDSKEKEDDGVPSPRSVSKEPRKGAQLNPSNIAIQSDGARHAVKDRIGLFSKRKSEDGLAESPSHATRTQKRDDDGILKVELKEYEPLNRKQAEVVRPTPVESSIHEDELIANQREDRDNEATNPNKPDIQSHVVNESSTPIKKDVNSIPVLPLPFTPSKSGPVTNAFDRMRPKRLPTDVATITIGDKTSTVTIGRPLNRRPRVHTPAYDLRNTQSGNLPVFGKKLAEFSASSTQKHVSAPISGELSSEDDDNDGEEVSTSSISSPTVHSDAEKGSPGEDSGKSRTNQNKPRDGQLSSKSDSDEEYIDESEKKAKEEERVAKMIADAEEVVARPIEDIQKRAQKILRGPSKKHSTLQLTQTISVSMSAIRHGKKSASSCGHSEKIESESTAFDSSPSHTAEQMLSLTVSKADFERMEVIGQFNLGFILALRPQTTNSSGEELFIIDQHASDEKYNFERFSKSTILLPQRLVHPHRMTLTAIEEEIVINHHDALTANGFFIDVNHEAPVGERCSLLTLPTSREVTFTPGDLEELLVLLADHVGSDIPRPTKVRKLLAMRACRSSIMIGKTLTSTMMSKIVRHLGEMDKPWNCPHGRPTMRHLYSMQSWKPWSEDYRMNPFEEKGTVADWKRYMKTKS